MLFNKNRNVEIENEYLATLLNNEELLDIAQIKPTYLMQPNAKKLLQYMLECYEQNKCVDISKIYEKHKDVDLDYYVKLLDDTIVYPSSAKEHFIKFENEIVKNYKKIILKQYNKKINNDEISYDEYVETIKKLDDVNVINSSNQLTSEELLNGINDEKMVIGLNNFPKLSKTLKLVQNDFLIVGATTGAGKSGFLLNLMNDLMFRYQCIYFNMEMSKSTIYKRIVSIRNNIPMNQVNHPLSENQKMGILNSLKDIEMDKAIVEHQANNIKDIKAIISQVKDKNRHTIVFIDHLGLCRCDNTKSLYEQATEVAKQLRQICLQYDCTIIGASQLNRAAYGSDEISLSMLKDSGELENSASKVTLLYRANKNKDEPENDVQMELEIAKNRDGLCGVIQFRYDKTKQVFKEKND